MSEYERQLAIHVPEGRSMLIGIDWGGTKIEGVAMERDGRELLRLRADTPRHDYFGCISVINDMITALEKKTGRTGSVGIGIPGSLEPVSRVGKGASSTWLLGRPVEKDLQECLKRDLRVENDADCFAASEAMDGAGAGYNVVFAVILGSGAGAGIAIGGKAHHGPNNSGGEWGHNPLPFPDVTELPGQPCYCGRHGCMETWVSGRAFEAEYFRHTQEELKAREIIERKRSGDRLSGLLWTRYIDRVARGLATVVNTLDPDILVMGGGMSNVDELYEDLPVALAERTFSTVFQTPICRAVHGDSSGVRGAAWLWSA
ncbi:ROK family protein [Ochrobactrum sp. EDr1-4]|uniref:ROK family protein n=1 Tax=Ochrobactrum sp. EDr1-4 TaxID=3368622 RepID=UPI003BA38C7D